MDKLFDLMFMGAKYQLLAATRLADIMQARPARPPAPTTPLEMPAPPLRPQHTPRAPT
jgi:hypothetical protein